MLPMMSTIPRQTTEPIPITIQTVSTRVTQYRYLTTIISQIRTRIWFSTSTRSMAEVVVQVEEEVEGTEVAAT